jgi:DHA2 family multidrug resistance protein
MSAAEPGAAAAWKPTGNPWLIAVVVTLAAFMEVLDTTIVNVALPHIAGTMSASVDESTWVLTSYLVANGIVLPISGWLSTVFGRKRYFMVCIAMFTIFSLLCGVAESLPQLIICRVAQGFFGGGLQPNQQSIILDTFEPSQRGRAFSLTAIATIVAPVLGPTLGGIITDNASWRWIFLINVPIGIFAWIAVLRLVEDPPWAKAASRVGGVHVDYIGLALISLGLGCLQYVLDRGEDADWFNSNAIQIVTMVSVAGLVGAVMWLLYTDRPIVNLRALANRNFAIGTFMIFVMGLVLYSSSVLIPQLAQQRLGYTATLAGYLLSPGAVLILFVIPVISRILPLVQTRLIIAFGFICLGFACLNAGHLNAQPDFFTMAKLRAYQTFGVGFLFVPISTMAYATLPRNLNRDAASLYTMFRNIGGSVGIALATAMVTERGQVHMAHMAARMTPFDPAYNQTLARTAAALTGSSVPPTGQTAAAMGQMYQTLISQSSIMAYLDVFEYCGGLAFLLVPLCFLLPSTRPGTRAAPAAH